MTPYQIAQKFIGRKEVPGIINNSIIMEWLRLDVDWPQNDEVPWCSAFVNWCCWIADAPRTRSLLARSWLGIGEKVTLDRACQGLDVAVIKRGADPQPGPEDHLAPGHVGFYVFHYIDDLYLLGGNQKDSVCISRYDAGDLLGVRRLTKL